MLLPATIGFLSGLLGAAVVAVPGIVWLRRRQRVALTRYASALRALAGYVDDRLTKIESAKSAKSA